jgi:hypothetical protein
MFAGEYPQNLGIFPPKEYPRGFSNPNVSINLRDD